MKESDDLCCMLTISENVVSFKVFERMADDTML